MLEILKSFLFGLVEGITEWLPISSTGHMIILNEFVKLDCTPAFWEMFLVVIQLGAILAVIVLFWDRIFPFRFGGRKGPVIERNILLLWLKIITACIPAGLLVVLGLDEKCEQLFYHAIPVALALIVFGIAFILIEDKNKGKTPSVDSTDALTFRHALIIGLFQLIAAVFPGTSRSGATILGALMIGVSRVTASEFTFFLAIPVMLGASLLKLIKFGFAFTGMEAGLLLVGMGTAFVVSLFVIRFLMDYIKKHDFKVFGWYRIALGVLVIILGALHVITV